MTRTNYEDKLWGQMIRTYDKDTLWGQLIRTNDEDKWWGQMMRTNNEDKWWGHMTRTNYKGKRWGQNDLDKWSGQMIMMISLQTSHRIFQVMYRKLRSKNIIFVFFVCSDLFVYVVQWYRSELFIDTRWVICLSVYVDDQVQFSQRRWDSEAPLRSIM